jgi:hypothetical protein
MFVGIKPIGQIDDGIDSIKKWLEVGVGIQSLNDLFVSCL